MANTIRRLQKNIKQKDGSFITEHYETDATIVEYDSANSGLGCTNAQEAIDKLADYQNNLTIGGRNLALNTSNTYTDVSYTPNAENASTFLYKVLNDGFNVGDTMLIRLIVKYTNVVSSDGKQALLKVSGNGDVTNWTTGYLEGSKLYNLEGSGEIEILHKITIKEEHLKNSCWDLRIVYWSIKSGTLQIKNVKVEKGTKPTDWTPAIEDLINVNKITDRLDVTEDGFVLGGKAGKALQDQITDTKNDITNLTIGGRNLLPNTLTLKGYDKSSTFTQSTYKGFTVYENTFTADSSKYQDLALKNFIEPEPNTDYVFSFWAKGEGTILSFFYPNAVTKAEHCDGNLSYAGDGCIGTTLSPNWKRYWVRWTTKSDISGNKSIVLCRQQSNDSKLSFYGAKLEKGTKCSDWSPAPEDFQDQINNKLDKTGGTVTDRLYLQKGFNVTTYIPLDGNGKGTSGYVKMAQLKLVGTNCDSPIEFKISRRGCREMTTLSLLFRNTSNTLDPDPISFTYKGKAINAHLHKFDTSTWDLYVYKSEGYDSIAIVDVNMNMSYQGSRVNITYPKQYVQTLPSDTIKATLYNQASTSLVADKLTTARNITVDGHFSGQYSFDGSKDINLKLYNKYAMTHVGNRVNYPYHRIAKLEGTAKYSDHDMILTLHCPYKDRFGIIEVGCRRNGGTSEKSSITLKWIVRSNFNTNDVTVGYSSDYNNTYVDLFLNNNNTYDDCVISIVDSSHRDGIDSSWVLVNSIEVSNTTESDKLTSYECWKSIEEAGTELHGQTYTNIDVAVDSGIINFANKSSLLVPTSQRPADANIEIGKYNGISTMLATSKMTSNKPDNISDKGTDSTVLNLGWDTGLNWGSQIAVGANLNPHMAIRGCSDIDGWDEKWTHILDDNNYLKYINSLGGVDLANQTLSLDDLTLSDNSAKVRYYYCSYDSTGANITGRPDDSHKASFLLKVELFRYVSSKEYRTIQTYISSYDNKTFRRVCNSGTWSGWVCDLDSGNFKSYVTPSSIGAVSKPTQKSLTIPNTGWVDEVHGSYLKKLVLSVDGITENMIVNLSIALESGEVAVDCGFASINESGNGTLTFYAESVPSASINATYYVLN